MHRGCKRRCGGFQGHASMAEGRRGSRPGSWQGSLAGVLIAITPRRAAAAGIARGGDLGDYRRSTLMSVIPQQAAATAWLAVGVSRVPTTALSKCNNVRDQNFA